ncbi:chemotaxis protein CheW [Paucibacter soli]|uniref:chemotaxis protein CheW n=1 Tax=Paucibacter soli TaxID=3133433 RepID=UPI0030A9A6BA
MLYLSFRLGPDRYVLAACQVLEVLPMLLLRAWPDAPAPVAGLCNLRGRSVPVLDLCMLALGRPAAELLSTRMLLVQLGPPSRRLALLVEQATDTLRLEDGAFGAAQLRGAPWLGELASLPGGELVQRVSLQGLLPEAMLDSLFAAPALS